MPIDYAQSCRIFDGLSAVFELEKLDVIEQMTVCLAFVTFLCEKNGFDAESVLQKAIEGDRKYHEYL